MRYIDHETGPPEPGVGDTDTRKQGTIQIAVAENAAEKSMLRDLIRHNLPRKIYDHTDKLPTYRWELLNDDSDLEDGWIPLSISEQSTDVFGLLDGGFWTGRACVFMQRYDALERDGYYDILWEMDFDGETKSGIGGNHTPYIPVPPDKQDFEDLHEPA